MITSVPPSVPKLPKTHAQPQVSVQFDLLGNREFGHLFRKFEFKAVINGGYIVRAKLFDPSFNMLQLLAKSGYLSGSRSKVLRMRFRILAGPADQITSPEMATKPQIVNIISVQAINKVVDKGYLEFIGIDPPSWALNTGDASGVAFRGRVSSVIKQVVAKYAPTVQVDIGETVDSDENRWWMMRQDPKTFISSLLDWSSSITQQKTQWIIAMDDDKLIIKEQAELQSKARGYYRFWDGAKSTIHSWAMLGNNALSITNTKLVTQGIATVSGQFLDRIMDQDERLVFAKDTTTPNKQIARTTEKEAFTRPNDAPGAAPPTIGWSAMSAIPEVYSAGELGLRYEQYIDGRPRGLFLNLANGLMRLKLRVVGHGEYSNLLGLGVDTIFLRWTAEPNPEYPDHLYFLSGHWLIYGFHHVVDRGAWWTDLYVSRYDFNAAAKRVPSST